jgi:hypothetical protein
LQEPIKHSSSNRQASPSYCDPNEKDGLEDGDAEGLLLIVGARLGFSDQEVGAWDIVGDDVN